MTMKEIDALSDLMVLMNSFAYHKENDLEENGGDLVDDLNGWVDHHQLTSEDLERLYHKLRRAKPSE